MSCRKEVNDPDGGRQLFSRRVQPSASTPQSHWFGARSAQAWQRAEAVDPLSAKGGGINPIGFRGSRPWLLFAMPPR